MTLSLPPELEKRVETEIAMGGFQDSSQLIEEAVAKYRTLSIAAKHLKVSKGTLSIKMKAMNIKVSKGANL